MTKKLYLSFRVLTSLIFMVAGIGHLVNPDKVLARLHRSTIYEWLPMPNLFVGLVVISGVVMLVL